MDKSLQNKFDAELKEDIARDLKNLAHKVGSYVPAISNCLFAIHCGYNNSNQELLPYTSGGLALATGIARGKKVREESADYHPWDTPITSILRETTKSTASVGLDVVVSYALGMGAKKVVDYF